MGHRRPVRRRRKRKDFGIVSGNGRATVAPLPEGIRPFGPDVSPAFFRELYSACLTLRCLSACISRANVPPGTRTPNTAHKNRTTSDRLYSLSWRDLSYGRGRPLRMARRARVATIVRSKVQREVARFENRLDSRKKRGRKEARGFPAFAVGPAERSSPTPCRRDGEITVDSPFAAGGRRSAPQERSAVVKLLNLSPPARLKIAVIYYFLLLNDAATEYGPE